VPSKITFQECKRRVRTDLEREMGITKALQEQPNQESLDVIEAARQALEPVIEQSAEDLYRWYHR